MIRLFTGENPDRAAEKAGEREETQGCRDPQRPITQFPEEISANNGRNAELWKRMNVGNPPTHSLCVASEPQSRLNPLADQIFRKLVRGKNFHVHSLGSETIKLGLFGGNS